MPRWKSVPKDDPQSRWEIDTEKVIGEGGFGNVYRARDKKPPPSADPADEESSTPRECAAKQVSLAEPADRESFETEQKMLEAVAGHESIIQVYGTLVLDDNQGWIFLEMATGGELFDRLIDSRQLSERAAWPFASAIASAIAHCHKRGIMHRDVKLENVMLCADDPHGVRLIDFGLAYQMKLNEDGSIVDETLMDTAGTQAYRAPEINKVKGYSPLKVDVWAFGIVLFSLVSGFFPLQEATMEDWRFKRLFEAQKEGVGACESIYRTYKRTCPFTPSLVALLDGMLTIDPAKRLSVHEVTEAEWIQQKPAGSSKDASGNEGALYRSLGDDEDDDFVMAEELDSHMVVPLRQRAERG